MTDPFEPRWLIQARTHLGQAEIPGPRHSPVIAAWLHRLGAYWSDDETPWCGTFVAAVMDQSGLPLPKYWMRARDWLNWGVPLASPVVGCVAVLSRGPSMGHVGFVVGEDATWRQFILLLGGNQGNRVSVAAFDRNRVLGYRWPAAEPMPTLTALPSIAAERSTSEA